MIKISIFFAIFAPIQEGGRSKKWLENYLWVHESNLGRGVLNATRELGVDFWLLPLGSGKILPSWNRGSLTRNTTTQTVGYEIRGINVTHT